MTKPRIGLQMYSVRDHVSDKEQYAATLDKLAAIGYRVLQTGEPAMFTRAEFQDMLSARGMILCSVGSSIDQLKSDPKDAIEAAKAYGVGVVGVSTLPMENRADARGFELYAKELNAAGKRLYEEGGLRVSYHNHALEFASFGGFCGMDILFEQTDARYVEFCLDTHWMVAGGVHPADWIRRATGRSSILHWKDYGIDNLANKDIGAYTKSFLEIGQGNIDWLAVASASFQNGCKYLVVEQDYTKRDIFESLAISYNKMRELGVEA